IFDPFFTTKSQGRGTGLGLAVVHGIMKTHGGGVIVRSTPGSGSEFSLYFPAVKSKATEAETGGRGVVTGEGARLLCLADDKLILRATTRIFTRLGYRVAAYATASEALEALAASPNGFDLVLTDSSMPGRSGLDLFRALREARPHLPIVVMSGLLLPQ